MVYRFHPLAEAEFEDSIEWYAERSEKAKNNFIREVLFTARFVCQNPTAYPKIGGIKRRISLKRFPFSLIYVIEKKEIVILSVFHHARNPKIWKQR